MSKEAKFAPARVALAEQALQPRFDLAGVDLRREQEHLFDVEPVLGAIERDLAEQ